MFDGMYGGLSPKTLTPTEASTSTKAQSTTSQPIKPTDHSYNGNRGTTHMTPKHGLCTTQPAKDVQLFNRLDSLKLCAVTC